MMSASSIIILIVYVYTMMVVIGPIVILILHVYTMGWQ